LGVRSSSDETAASEPSITPENPPDGPRSMHWQHELTPEPEEYAPRQERGHYNVSIPRPPAAPRAMLPHERSYNAPTTAANIPPAAPRAPYQGFYGSSTVAASVPSTEPRGVLPHQRAYSLPNASINGPSPAPRGVLPHQSAYNPPNAGINGPRSVPRAMPGVDAPPTAPQGMLPHQSTYNPPNTGINGLSTRPRAVLPHQSTFNPPNTGINGPTTAALPQRPRANTPVSNSPPTTAYDIVTGINGPLAGLRGPLPHQSAYSPPNVGINGPSTAPAAPAQHLRAVAPVSSDNPIASIANSIHNPQYSAQAVPATSGNASARGLHGPHGGNSIHAAHDLQALRSEDEANVARAQNFVANNFNGRENDQGSGQGNSHNIQRNQPQSVARESRVAHGRGPYDRNGPAVDFGKLSFGSGMS
jgi:hypothetical protein